MSPYCQLQRCCTSQTINLHMFQAVTPSGCTFLPLFSVSVSVCFYCLSFLIPASTVQFCQQIHIIAILFQPVYFVESVWNSSSLAVNVLKSRRLSYNITPKYSYVSKMDEYTFIYWKAEVSLAHLLEFFCTWRQSCMYILMFVVSVKQMWVSLKNKSYAIQEPISFITLPDAFYLPLPSSWYSVGKAGTWDEWRLKYRLLCLHIKCWLSCKSTVASLC